MFLVLIHDHVKQPLNCKQAKLLFVRGKQLKHIVFCMTLEFYQGKSRKLLKGVFYFVLIIPCMFYVKNKQAVIEANIILPLVHLLQHAEFDIKKEAAWAISNATSGGSHEQIRYAFYFSLNKKEGLRFCLLHLTKMKGEGNQSLTLLIVQSIEFSNSKT